MVRGRELGEGWRKRMGYVRPAFDGAD
jgi:hypothetical protein